MSDKEKFTIKGIDPEVLRRARIMAINKDKPLSEILRDNLKELVEEYEKEKRYQETKP